MMMLRSIYFLPIALLCMLQCIVSSATAQLNANPKFHLYVLIGQSNMAGRGQPDSLSKITNPHILMLDSLNGWMTATDPVHFDKPKSVGVGPAISFAQSMLEEDTSISIGLIPCAWGGSPIRVWEPGAVYLETAHPYDDAIKRTKVAMQAGVLKGILWHQGESDNDSAKAAVYLAKLTSLIERLRRDLQQPNLPFVAGEIGYFNERIFINSVINQLPQAVPYTKVVSANGLTHKGDKLHFNTESARELGRRYAEAMKQLQNALKH